VLSLTTTMVMATDGNPGFRVCLTNKGMDYAREVEMPILAQELQSLTIPDISGSAESPVGHIDYDISNIKASTVNLGTSAIDSQTDGIHLDLNSATIGLTAHWHYREHSWPHVSDSGSVDISAEDISINLVLDVGMSSSHEPTISIPSCSGGVHKIDLKFHGGASWLYNLFTGLIGDTVKDALNKELCSEIQKELVETGNKLLSTLPTTVDLDDYAEINFELIQAPNTTSTYLLTSHRGAFVTKSHNTTLPPFNAAPVPYPSNVTRMFYLFIDEYLARSAGWAYQQAGYLQWVITNNDVPSGFPVQLTTASLGQLVPGLLNVCANCTMDMHLAAIEDPLAIQINASTGLDLVLTFNISTYINPPTGTNGTDKFAFALQARIFGDGTVHLYTNQDTEYIGANISFVKVDLAVVDSAVGKIDPSLLQDVMNVFCQEVIVPQLNKHITQGFPIPTVDGLTFVGPEIVFGDGYVRIDTDISYTPSA